MAWVGRTYAPEGVAWLASAATTAIARLEAHGAKVPLSGRLHRARRIAENLRDGRLSPDDTAEWDRTREAFRTIWEFALIANTIPTGHAPTLQNVRQALAGPFLPNRHRDDPARNSQFELYVAALLAMGDVKTRGMEPDLRFTTAYGEYGVAVKRVRSPKKLQARASHAARQLRNHGVRGLVAVNMEAFLEDLSVAEATVEEAGKQFTARVGALNTLLEKVSAKAGVVGVLGMGTVVEWQPEAKPPNLDLRWFFQLRLVSDDRLENERLEAFFGKFRDRVNERTDRIFGQDPPEKADQSALT
jgi:hypothetical protein